MKYMGSKRRLQKYLTPIIQEYIQKENFEAYVEPFVGGANMIESIKHSNKIGYDNNIYVIALLQELSINGLDRCPKTITREHYVDVRNSYKNNDKQYEDWYIGYIGITGSYNGRFMGGYSGHEVKVKDGKMRDYIGESYKALIIQSPLLKNTSFIYKDFGNIKCSNCIIYCDPPYKNTTQYATSKNFDHNKFYQWCRDMSKDNLVLVSEYSMPSDFKCIWSKTIATSMKDTMQDLGKAHSKIERLFILDNRNINEDK